MYATSIAAARHAEVSFTSADPANEYRRGSGGKRHAPNAGITVPRAARDGRNRCR